MPDCRLCGLHFPNRVMIDGQLRNVSTRRYCLDCSPSGLHNTRILEPHGPREPRAPSDPTCHKACARCGRTKPLSEYSLRPDGRRSFSWCRECNNEHRRARFRADLGSRRDPARVRVVRARGWHAGDTAGMAADRDGRGRDRRHPRTGVLPITARPYLGTRDRYLAHRRRSAN